jgi:uncharacterized integral membrane protein (TIGR00698 family)
LALASSRLGRAASTAAGLPDFFIRFGPGVLACAAVSAVSVGLQALESRVLGRPWLESLVLAILLGAAARLVWRPGVRFGPGVAFSAKTLLEVAVVLLGASVSAATLWSIGPVFLLIIAAVVAVAIALAYAMGRLVGLKRRMAVLIACGNAICGNSAIVAIAPVIGADGEDIAASIAFTALLGVVAVIALPLLGAALHMQPVAYGAWAGLTVYAVPQVLAATAPMGSSALQAGTLVKLVRVLMLGPVSLALSIAVKRGDRSDARPATLSLHKLVPWFILGFLALAALRSFGAIPAPVLKPVAETANVLTVIAMAGLGLSTDLRAVARAGAKASAAATFALVTLAVIAFGAVLLRRYF